MKPTLTTITPISDADYVAASQTPGAAGNLTLNPSFTTSGKIVFDNPHLITITGGSNESGKTLTVTGLGDRGEAQTEVITGPNATTVASTKYWSRIDSIAVSAATTGAITVGTNGKCVTPWMPQNIYAENFDLSIGVSLSGTATYGAQFTLSDIQDTSTALVVGTHGVMTGLTSSDYVNMDFPVTAVRGIVTSWTSGTLTLQTILAG